MGVIPVSSDDPPRKVVESLKAAKNAIEDGYLVCIFAEGALTRNGNMRAFRGGYERIIKGSDHPVIPVYLGGAWGSIFSYYRGKLLAGLPKAIPYPTRVLFGSPLPASASPFDVRNAVMELSCDSFDMLKSPRRTLAYRFVSTARCNWFKTALSDTTGKLLSYGRLLTGAIAMGQLIRKGRDDEDMIGIVLPSSVGGAVANIAVTLLGKVPVNLNFTASENAVSSAIEQCKIKTIISSRRFLEQIPAFHAPEGVLYLEDLLPQLTSRDRLQALLKALFATPRSISRGLPVSCDSMATIIFSSGSTGEPKGVMLSHHNLLSNIEAIQLAFRFEKRDRLCAVLPFFHSFGFTATLWAPIVCGFSAMYHPNPLDGSGVGAMVRENRLTTLLATPTFLLSYIRRAKPEDFSSLRAVVTGAEKLKARIADSFEERFSIRPLEGYGTTELAPVASLNLPYSKISVESEQPCAKAGSVGHPVPGIAARIVDPDTGATLAVGEEGLLEIKGPNVMLGYLGRPEETDNVLRLGWYNTGDLAVIDEDGFIFIRDRLSRYSKIGGEMVPHLAVEDVLVDALGSVEPCVVVTGAPDQRKGEQLVVCYTDAAGTGERLHEIIRESELPNLWKPKRDNFVQIDTIPTLGSGKLDLKAVREIAREFVDERPGKVQQAITKIQESL